MSAGLLDLVCEQGSTFRRVITWRDENKDRVDLTGYTAQLQVRRFVGDTETALVDATTENDGISLGGTDGTITVVITDEDTAALPVGVWRYDLEMTPPNGETTRLLKGKWTVDGEVTSG